VKIHGAKEMAIANSPPDEIELTNDKLDTPQPTRLVIVIIAVSALGPSANFFPTVPKSK
jgi:hypothetical protein